MSRPRKLGEILAEERAAEAKKLAEKAQKAVRKAPPAPATASEEVKAAQRSSALRKSRLKLDKEAAQTPVEPPRRSVEKDEATQRAADEAFAMPYAPPVFTVDPGDDPEAELAARELCRRHLLPFIQRFRPKYLAGWVHADICRRFERFLKDVEAGREPHLLLMMPPRAGKSEISSRHFAPWVLGQHPDWEIIAASHTSGLTMTFSRYIRDLMSGDAYRVLFPDAMLDPNSRSVENWNLTNGGGYMAAGVGTGITGRGAHILLLDDLVKDMEAASSTTIRDNTWEWYISTANTRLAPGGGVLGLMCMTGDTPVMMADGTQKRLDTVGADDHVATYQNGKLAEARVAARKSSGRDLVFKITTTSDKIVRANQRHPFLTITPDGELAWTRVRNLTTAHRIVALKGSGGSGGELHAPWMDATNLQNAEASVITTTTRKSGLTDTRNLATTAKLDVAPDSSTVTELPQRSTTPCMKRKEGAARSAVNMLSMGVHQSTGKISSQLITVTIPEGCEHFSATTVMPGSGTLALSKWHLPQQNISDFIAEPIASVEPDGFEEVFDLQVDDTENFIANGVVSHNTWWHDDDWAGRIQQTMESGDGDVFEIVKYPAINETGDEYILPDDTIVEIPPGQLVPRGARLTRRHNTAIHPERYSTERMLRIKKNNFAAGLKRVWDALYQQNPVPDEGNYFSKDFFRYYSSPPPRSELYVYQAWDFAISEGTESDYTVGVTIGVDSRDSIYVLDVRRFKTSDGILLVETMVDYALEWDVECLGVEDGQIWKAVESQFQKVCDEKRCWPAYEPLKPLTDKMVRASPLRGRMQAGKVYFDEKAPWFKDLYKEFLHFPAGKHDDCHTYGTLIDSPTGQRLMGELRDGDEVFTYDGSNVLVGMVAEHHCTGSKPVLEVSFSDGTVVEMTAGHPVLTDRGYVYAGNLTTSDRIVRRIPCTSSDTGSSGSRKAEVITSQQPCLQTGDEPGCTGTRSNGRSLSSLKVGTFIMLTGTRTTTRLRTLSACLLSIMRRSIARIAEPSERARNNLRTWKRFDRWRMQRSGANTSVSENCVADKSEPAFAQLVERFSNSQAQRSTEPCTAQISAGTRLTTSSQTLITRLKKLANIVVSRLPLGATGLATSCSALNPVATSTGTTSEESCVSAGGAGRVTSLEKATPLAIAARAANRVPTSTDGSALRAGEKLYPASMMGMFSAIESVLTSSDDSRIVRTSMLDTNRGFVKVVSIREIGFHLTYNFEVARTHNYLVHGGIVVHNCIDATAWAVRLTLSRAAPKPKDTEPRLKSWKDKLKLHGTGASHMAA